MSNQTDYEAWLEGISDFHTAVDDAWSRIFALHLGTYQPDSSVRAEFREFVSGWCMDVEGKLSATEDEIIELFPDFLNHLVRNQKA